MKDEVMKMLISNGTLLSYFEERRIAVRKGIPINKNLYEYQNNSRELKKGKTSLKLTERETDMILFLNKSKKPVNVETLEKEIWQHSSELETHTVETHIYRLRKKILNVFGDENFIFNNNKGYSIN